MNQEEQKLKRGDYIIETIKKYLETEPKISLEELAFILDDFLGDKFFKIYEKERKKA